MKTLLQTLFFFLLVTQVCFAQWYQQNSGTTKNLNKVQFIDADNGWAVGDSGTIIKTTNAGATWVQQASGTSHNLLAVCFKNTYTGWAIGGSGEWWNPDSAIVLKTTDSGLNWIKQLIIKGKFYDVCFTNENSGYVVGYGEDSPGEFRPVLFRTTDSGLTWFHQFQDTMTYLSSIDFIDDNNGWLVEVGWGGMGGFPLIIKTTADGGSNWVVQYIPGMSIDESKRIRCFNSELIFVVGYAGDPRTFGFIIKTTNGGIDWTMEGYSYGFCPLNDVCISSVDVVTMVGCGKIFRSIDKGATWSIQTADSVGELIGVDFIGDNTGWVVGTNGSIYHTTNGGVFVEEEQIDGIPAAYNLTQNFPNPFNPSTKIKYSVPQTSQVQIKVFDVLGNEIETLVNEEKLAGTYELTWYAANLPSGVYFYQLKAGDFISTKKMILIK